MNKITFSVIVPVYNSSNYLKQCIDSILCQKGSPFELLLIDDGSTDGSPAMCDAYTSCYSNVSVMHKKNHGKSAALIDGIRAATGDYLVFIDSDDWVSDDYFERLSQYLKDNLDVLICGYISEPSGKRIVHGYRMNKICSGLELIESNPALHTSYDACFSVRMVFSRKFVQNNQILPRTDIIIGEDTDFNLRALKIAAHTMAVSYCGYHYRTDNSNSLVHQRYMPSLERDLDLQYSTRKCVSTAENYTRNMAEYYITRMIYTVIRNCKESPNGMRLKDVRRILNYNWVTDSYNKLQSGGVLFPSKKEYMLQLMFRYKIIIGVYIYYSLYK